MRRKPDRFQDCFRPRGGTVPWIRGRIRAGRSGGQRLVVLHRTHCPAPRGVYIKIPKDSIARNRILPVSEGAARLAREEYESLLHLNAHWQADDLDVSFVTPLGFFPEYNAIVTERAYAAPLLSPFRRTDLLRRFGVGNVEDQVHGALRRFGQALARYHDTSAKPAGWKGDDFLPKLRSIVAELAGLGLAADPRERLTRAFAEIAHLAGDGETTLTIKGLDVRNLLMADGRVHVLDPGMSRTEYREADLARFLMTIRILWWGSPMFALGFTPHESYADQFLAGYDYRAGKPGALLSLLLLKELLKTWRMAYHALAGKGWPAPVKHLVRAIYIDPFFNRHLKREIFPWV